MRLKRSRDLDDYLAAAIMVCLILSTSLVVGVLARMLREWFG